MEAFEFVAIILNDAINCLQIARLYAYKSKTLTDD